MLERLRIERFKSIRSLSVDLADFSVFFGPNAVGKSNIIDAVQLLSNLGTHRTVADAFDGAVRGLPIEAFSIEGQGITAALDRTNLSLELEARLQIRGRFFEYLVEISLAPRAGQLTVSREFLSELKKRTHEPLGNPKIKTEGNRVTIATRQGRPRIEEANQNHTKLSDTRMGGAEYSAIRTCRDDLHSWKFYYLDPRISMREARPPSEVYDIGSSGQNIAPFLYRLKMERPNLFKQVSGSMSALIPTVTGVDVELDAKRGTLDINIEQNGTRFSSRIISEGTLRVLGLVSIAINPWASNLIAFEEPENGIHPQRIELVASLLGNMTRSGKQILVTSHSPIFCSSAFKLSRNPNMSVGLFAVRQGALGTTAQRLNPLGPLFDASEVDNALRDPDESDYFQRLMSSGFLDVA